jgi:hypothetical protein
LAAFDGIARRARTAWLSENWRFEESFGEESGLQACYGKSPGNGAFFYEPDSPEIRGTWNCG